MSIEEYLSSKTRIIRHRDEKRFINDIEFYLENGWGVLGYSYSIFSGHSALIYHDKVKCNICKEEKNHDRK